MMAKKIKFIVLGVFLTVVVLIMGVYIYKIHSVFERFSDLEKKFEYQEFYIGEIKKGRLKSFYKCGSQIRDYVSLKEFENGECEFIWFKRIY